MKNFPNKLAALGVISFTLSSTLYAEPIRLLPKTIETPKAPVTQTLSGLWEGTPPTTLETYLSKIPVHLTSPTLRKLRITLLKPLLNNAALEKDLITLFMKIGLLTEAKDLLSESKSPEKDSLLLDILWLEGEPKKACEKITNLMRSGSNLDWKKQNIYCLSINGEEERAKIALELLKESKAENIEVLNALFDKSLKLPLTPTSPFLLTVWTKVGTEISEKDLKTLTPSQIMLLARSATLPPKTHLSAILRAAEEGYPMDKQIDDLPKEDASREVLLQLREAFKSPKAETLIPLLQKAEDIYSFEALAEILKPKLDPSQEYLPLAPFMIRASLFRGDISLAQKWGTFLMQESPKEYLKFSPLLFLAIPESKWRDSGENSPLLKEILVALSEAPETKPINAPYSDQLSTAVKGKRKGEVLLFTLLIIGETPLKEMPSDIFISLLSNLQKAGLSEEAKALALEYLLVKSF